MIPKIIHNIWIQGYEQLPEKHKLTYQDIKKLNPEWEFMFWDEPKILDLLKKYPNIYNVYKNVESLSGMIHNNALKSDITRYILMKEYGGLYFDIDFVCTTSFDNLFTKDNAIYIASSKIDFLDYIYPFSKPKYCSAFMAFEKEHPIWIKVIPILLNATTKYQVGSALDISLQNNNNYEIVVLNEIKAPYQCNHTNTICYTTVESSWNTIRPILQFINCNQAAVFIILMIIVMSIVMFFYNQNYKNVFNVIFKPRNRANKNKRRLSREI